MSESRVRENRMHGLKRRGLETERQPPRQSPTLPRHALRACSAAGVCRAGHSSSSPP